jgi:hypothetical protein
VPEQDLFRAGSEVQYSIAMKAGAAGIESWTDVHTDRHLLIDDILLLRGQTADSVFVYGTEGGLGRFVLCSERCLGASTELHKETVLRMPTEGESEDGVVWMGCSRVNDICHISRFLGVILVTSHSRLS